jgi:ribosomal RNA-processing protein 17
MEITCTKKFRDASSKAQRHFSPAHCLNHTVKMGPIVKRRKLDKFRAPAVEELTFDPSARSEYLTGFSKRKQARKDHARETAVKLAKEERIRDRKQVCMDQHENRSKSKDYKLGLDSH